MLVYVIKGTGQHHLTQILLLESSHYRGGNAIKGLFYVR